MILLTNLRNLLCNPTSCPYSMVLEPCCMGKCTGVSFADSTAAKVISNISNGQVESQVNKLKTIKRMMYERGSFSAIKNNGVGYF